MLFRGNLFAHRDSLPGKRNLICDIERSKRVIPTKFAVIKLIKKRLKIKGYSKNNGVVAFTSNGYNILFFFYLWKCRFSAKLIGNCLSHFHIYSFNMCIAKVLANYSYEMQGLSQK